MFAVSSRWNGCHVLLHVEWFKIICLLCHLGGIYHKCYDGRFMGLTLIVDGADQSTAWGLDRLQFYISLHGFGGPRLLGDSGETKGYANQHLSSGR